MNAEKKKRNYLLPVAVLVSLLALIAGCLVLDTPVTDLKDKDVLGVWYLDNDRRATLTFALPDKLKFKEMPLAALAGDRTALTEISGSGNWSIRKNEMYDSVFVVDVSLTGETARKYNSSSHYELSVDRSAKTGLYLYTDIGDPDSGDRYMLVR